MINLGDKCRIMRTLAVVLGLAAGGLVAGCGERTEPLPAEAKTPGELRPPTFTPEKAALAKNVNPKGARSIKDVQSKP